MQISTITFVRLLSGTLRIYNHNFESSECKIYYKIRKSVYAGYVIPADIFL